MDTAADTETLESSLGSPDLTPDEDFEEETIDSLDKAALCFESSLDTFGDDESFEASVDGEDDSVYIRKKGRSQ